MPGVEFDDDRVLVVGGSAAAGDDATPADGVRVDLITQLPRRFAVVVLDPALATMPRERRRAALHQAVQHLEPGGSLSIDDDAAAVFEPDCHELGLEPGGRADGTVTWRRTRRTTVHDLVFEARRTIRRVDAHELSAELASARPPFVVDTRTPTDLARTGVIAGSVHVPRTVLEWHLDPANGYRHPAAPGFDGPIVVVCNGGYSSSLAAANLRRIGFTDVADLIGGIHAWQVAGLPLSPPDHTHLDVSIASVIET